MKAEFSKTWNTSTQPRKQRKYRHNAPIHVRRKFLSAHLSKHLRKEYGRRSAKLRTEDVVRIMRGEFAGKEGKVQKVDISKSTVFVEGISKKKAGGKEFQAPIQASNVQIVELNLKDEKRIRALKKKKKSAVKAEKLQVEREHSEMKTPGSQLSGDTKEEKPKTEAK